MSQRALAAVLSATALLVVPAVADAMPSTYARAGKVRAPDLAKGAVTRAKIKKRAVGSKQIAANAIKGAHVVEASLDAAILQRRVANGCGLGSAIRAITIEGGVTCEPVGGPASAAPSGPAGGDLAGSYPNPTIAGGKVTTAKLADGAVTSGKLGLPIERSGTLPTPALSLQTDDSPEIAYPNADQAIVSVRRTNTTAVGPAVYGSVSSIFGNFGTAGVMGESAGTGGVGMLAFASNPSGNGPGLLALSNGNGNGITAKSDDGNGIEASSDSSADNGVYAFQPSYAGGGNGAGVLARSFADSGTALRATANGASGVALRATATAPATQSAIFTGNVNVLGTLSKTAGSFKLDHPLHPSTKYLSHSFVESPDMKNIYDGVVRTDARGFATVRMPGWFDALNRDFRYQLTVIGRSFAKAIVWEELRDGRFVIRTDEPGVKVSWMVTGIRDDAYARANRIRTVTAKRGAERGRYLYPQGFGKPASRQIGR